MAGFDSGVFAGPFGSLRLFTLILGAVTVGLTADSYHRGSENEDFFFWTAVVLLIVSAILAVALFVGLTGEAIFLSRGDTLFHLIGGIVFLVASILMIISILNIGSGQSTGKYIQRISAGAIGLINALVYTSLGWNTCRNRGGGMGI